MGQLLIRNVPDETIATFKLKAELNGRSLEQELRELLERNQPFTPEERVALSRSFRASGPREAEEGAAGERKEEREEAGGRSEEAWGKEIRRKEARR